MTMQQCKEKWKIGEIYLYGVNYCTPIEYTTDKYGLPKIICKVEAYNGTRTLTIDPEDKRLRERQKTHLFG